MDEHETLENFIPHLSHTLDFTSDINSPSTPCIEFFDIMKIYADGTVNIQGDTNTALNAVAIGLMNQFHDLFESEIQRRTELRIINVMRENIRLNELHTDPNRHKRPRDYDEFDNDTNKRPRI